MASFCALVTVAFSLFSIVLGAPSSREYPVDDCFEQNYDYPGKDLEVARKLYTVKNNAKECQALCARTDECKFFTYSTSNKRCYLKTANAGKVYEKGAISGRKECALNPETEAELNPDGVSRKEFRDIFNKADEDGNGELSNANMKVLMRNQFAELGQAHLLTDEQLGLVVDTSIWVADTNKDGSLSVEEYLKVMMKGADQKQTVFDKFDKNGDGKLSSSELIAANRELQGPGNYNQSVRMMIRQKDQDGDGKLNFQEYSAGLQ